MLDMLYIKVIKKYSLLDIAKHIHRHKAASRGCLFMAPMCRSKLCVVSYILFDGIPISLSYQQNLGLLT